MREETKQELEEKSQTISKLQAGKGKQYLMFAIAVKLRQMLFKELMLAKAEATKKEQEIRSGAAASRTTEI